MIRKLLKDGVPPFWARFGAIYVLTHPLGQKNMLNTHTANNIMVPAEEIAGLFSMPIQF